jgi:hypothetical protein
MTTAESHGSRYEAEKHRARRAAGAVAAKPVTVADLLAGSPAADWRAPNPDDTLYLELPNGRVVIELAARAVPQHAANIKALARAHYFDGLAIVRVQDNYVVQWGDESQSRPLAAGVRPSVEFTADAGAAARFATRARTRCGSRTATVWWVRAGTTRRRAPARSCMR